MTATMKRLACWITVLLLALSVTGLGAFRAEAAGAAVQIEAESGTFMPADKKEGGQSNQGNTWVSGFQNMVASYTVSDIEAGNYKLSAYYVSSVDRSGTLKVKVGDTTVSAVWARTGEWDWSEAATMVIGNLTLEPGDTIQVWTEGASPYIQIDYFTLTPTDEQPSEGGTVTEPDLGGICYQAEDYYGGNISENVAADLQPGEVLEFDLSSNTAFADGTYLLTVRSCGNRESFTIKVNGAAVDVLSRAGTDFGQIYMTDDVVATPIELKAGDILSVCAPNGEYWGWVDYILLTPAEASSGGTVLEGEAVEVGDGYYIFQAEYFSNLLVGDNTAANLISGEVLEIPLSRCEGFEDGYYFITVVSCGNRETIYLRINGESIGSITRLGTNLNLEGMTEKKFGQKKQLTSEDVLSLVAPGDGTTGWIDYVILTKTTAPGGAAAVDPTEPSESAPTDPPAAEDPQPSVEPVVVIAVIAVIAVAAVVVVLILRKKKPQA